jgi:hypothetical protein
MVNAGDHILDDFFGCVPDAEVLTQLGIEGFKEGLVEVSNGFVFAKSCEKSGLNAVEGFSGEIEHLLELDGVESAGVGDFAEEFAEDRDPKIVCRNAPVEASIGNAALGRTPPENPGREDAVEEGLDEGGAEEVLAFFALKADAERFLEGSFDCIETGERMVFHAGAGFACIGRQKPCYVSGLDERRTIKHDAGEKVGEEIFVFGKC